MEIERKFLVDLSKWKNLEKPEPIFIQQGYISKNKECTVRVRTKNKKAYLTVKGVTVGISREEFEYEIPFSEASEMLALFCEKKIEKNRYEIVHGGKIWEVDEFKGNLAPLVLAEIELTSEDEFFDVPEFVTEDVSENANYYNSVLIDKL